MDHPLFRPCMKNSSPGLSPEFWSLGRKPAQGLSITISNDCLLKPQPGVLFVTVCALLVRLLPGLWHGLSSTCTKTVGNVASERQQGASLPRLAIVSQCRTMTLPWHCHWRASGERWVPVNTVPIFTPRTKHSWRILFHSSSEFQMTLQDRLWSYCATAHLWREMKSFQRFKTSLNKYEILQQRCVVWSFSPLWNHSFSFALASLVLFLKWLRENPRFTWLCLLLPLLDRSEPCQSVCADPLQAEKPPQSQPSWDRL